MKLGLAFLTLIMATSAFAQTDKSKAELNAVTPIILPGKAGRFDYMEVDAKNDRLLAAHAESKLLTVFDLKSNGLVSEIAVGKAQGVVVDNAAESYIVGDSAEHKIVFVSTKTLKPIGEVPVTGPVDAVAFDAKNGLTYADEDDGSHVWVVSQKEKKVVATIELPGVPEFVVYDPGSDRVYQNIKTKNSLVVINPATNKIEATWSTLPATEPHGLAVDSKSAHGFIAGKNGKLAEVDLKTGKILGSADIKPGPDQIAFEADAKLIYCASKGFISVVRETDSGLELVGDYPAPAGAHTIATDSRRHGAWVSYADKEHSFLQNFKYVSGKN